MRINQRRGAAEKESSPIYIHTHTHTQKFRQLTLLGSRKAQSALEYMMTYGWAILIIVIVAVILYSMGIFNPASSISSTITGFSATPVSNAICTANGVLRIAVGDTTGHRILIKNISATSNGKTEVFTPSSTVDPNPIITSGNTYIFSVPNVCPAAGTRFSANVNINYTEPTTPFPTSRYTSTGTITGTTTSTILPSVAAYFNGNAYFKFICVGSPLSCVISGSNSYVNATDPLPGINRSYTLILWALDTGIFNENYNSSFVRGAGNDSNGLFAFSTWQAFGVGPTNNGDSGPGLHRCSAADTFVNIQTNFFNNEWHFVAVSVNKPNYVFEIDGTQYTTTNDNAFASGNLLSIGSNGFKTCDEGPFTGYITNVQLYNGSLSSSQLTTLYNEGIIGNPLLVSSVPLVGWWPLNSTVNGLAKDYSGTDNGNFINSYISSNFP